MGRILSHPWRTAAALLVGATLVVLTAPGAGAHKGVTSKYNYNQHVFPILRDRCGQCHFEGGPTPMSLMTYRDAIPWAESIREQLVGQKQPPWYADPTGPAVRGGHALAIKELDILVTWAAGGTPQSTEMTFTGGGTPAGDASAPPAFAPDVTKWRSGPPDLTVKMDAPYTLPGTTVEDTHEFILPTNLAEEKWVSAVDLLPGTPSIVLDAVVSIENGPVLGAWVAGEEPVPAPSGAAFRLPVGAKLRLRIHYKKQWRDENTEKSDLSTVGLYFTDAPLGGRALETFSLKALDPAAGATGPRTFTGVFGTAGRVVGIRPSVNQPYARVEINAVLPAGRRVQLLRLRAPQPQYYRRYWLVEPIELPKDSKVEVTATLAAHDEGSVSVATQRPLQVDLEFVPQ